MLINFALTLRTCGSVQPQAWRCKLHIETYYWISHSPFSLYRGQFSADRPRATGGLKSLPQHPTPTPGDRRSVPGVQLVLNGSPSVVAGICVYVWRVCGDGGAMEEEWCQRWVHLKWRDTKCTDANVSDPPCARCRRKQRYHRLTDEFQFDTHLFLFLSIHTL